MYGIHQSHYHSINIMIHLGCLIVVIPLFVYRPALLPRFLDNGICIHQYSVTSLLHSAIVHIALIALLMGIIVCGIVLG